MSTQVVLMAGGKGTRLRPFTAVLPKPLVPLGDMPIIEVLLRRLGTFSFRNITISTGYLAELIQAVCGDGSKYGVNIDYVREESPLGTAGALSLVNEMSDPVLVMNGDLLTTLNFEALVDYHVAQEADVTIATYARDVRIDFGVVEVDDNGAFVGFKEKPTYAMDVSMGVNVLSPRALALIDGEDYLDMPTLILKVRDSGGKVACYKEDCYWLDIGRLDDYSIAQQEFEEKADMFLGR